MRTILFAVLCIAATASVAGQQMYRWTGADGRVYYTDKPPPADAKAVERKRLGDPAGTAQLPYALQQATKVFPVTLFTADCGDACDAGLRLLERRGIPHAEKNARDETVQAELKKLTGIDEIDVPVLVVGRTIVRGWQASQWNAALDAANYPRTSQLPKAGASKPLAKPKADAAKPAAETTPAKP